MRKVYQSCGQFNLKNLTAIAYTTLPDSRGLICNYIKYYNISTDTEYAVFGIMVDNHGNLDLRNSNDPSIDVLVAPQPIELQNIDNKFSSRDFRNLTKDDTIYFFTWHDNDFDEGVLRLLQHEETKPSDLLKTFRNKNNQDESIIATKKLNILEPKVGDGGILTADGFC
ncbi:hypothetical protein [Flavobacterium sp.]|uniref:hypothetical protein n=1 Tax=Flavobacterium sp. TaxID=239 RepID=UPI0037534967